MEPMTVVVAFRPNLSGHVGQVEIPNVYAVDLIKEVDNEGKSIWYFSLDDCDSEEMAAFPFDAVAGWWRKPDREKPGTAR